METTAPPASTQTDLLSTEAPEPTEATPHISRAAIYLYQDLDQAMRSATSTAAGTGGRLFPCTIFEQGGRTMAVTSFPANELGSLVEAKPVEKEDDPSKAGNRPVIPDHVRKIRDYLVENYDEYVLPPLSITYRDRLPIYTTSEGKVRLGFMVVPAGTKAHVTDGQHRYFGLVGYSAKKKSVTGAIEECEQLERDAVAVQITIEDDLRRCHQDFADMAQTKALPKSLLTAYDLRDPVNGLVADLVEGSPLLRGRVDSTGKSLAKGSRRVALSNWIRNLVKGAIARDYFVADADMPKVASEHLPNKEQRELLRADLNALLLAMTTHVPELKEIAAIDPTSPQADQVPALRARTLACTAVGLGISGMVLRVIRTYHAEENEKLALIEQLFTTVDWSRYGELDAVWRDGGVVSDGTSIRSARTNIFVSTARILERLGLPLDERHERALAKAAAKAAEAAEAEDNNPHATAVSTESDGAVNAETTGAAQALPSEEATR